MWKILIAQRKEEITRLNATDYIQKNGKYAVEEQKKEKPYKISTSSRRSKPYKKMKSWIDYYINPHTWIIICLKIYNISNKLIIFIMKSWKPEKRIKKD